MRDSVSRSPRSRNTNARLSGWCAARQIRISLIVNVSDFCTVLLAAVLRVDGSGNLRLEVRGNVSVDYEIFEQRLQ